MKILRSPFFIICSIIFLGHQFLQHIANINSGLADDYLDNLLAMPIILPLIQAERHLIAGNSRPYKLTDLEIVMATIYIIGISEILFPILSSKFTADWIDIPCYALGALLLKLTN